MSGGSRWVLSLPGAWEPATAPLQGKLRGRKGTVHAKGANNDGWKNGHGPSNAAASFGTRLLGQDVPFQTSPAPRPLPSVHKICSGL